MNEQALLLLERVRMAKKAYRLSNNLIAQAANMSIGTVTNQMQGKYHLDIRVLMAILSLCNDLSAEWLMRGRGDMMYQVFVLQNSVTPKK
ncbi:MAG: hypothetical protein J6V13_03975 [Paludibacteraceae bacterium]|nr:hypothetical protein [Paludibacteraceae bacterium]